MMNINEKIKEMILELKANRQYEIDNVVNEKSGEIYAKNEEIDRLAETTRAQLRENYEIKKQELESILNSQLEQVERDIELKKNANLTLIKEIASKDIVSKYDNEIAKLEQFIGE